MTGFLVIPTFSNDVPNNSRLWLESYTLFVPTVCVSILHLFYELSFRCIPWSRGYKIVLTRFCFMDWMIDNSLVYYPMIYERSNDIYKKRNNGLLK